MTFNRIETTGVNASTYTDNSAKSRTTYYYRVQAYNADGASGYTNVLTVTTM